MATSELESVTTVAETDDEILTPLDLERRFKIKVGTQKSLRSRGRIPYIRVGGERCKLIRYRLTDIRAWLDASSVPAVQR